MLFTYHAIDQDGHERDGTIEAPSQEIAVSSLQRRNLIISVIESTEDKSLLSKKCLQIQISKHCLRSVLIPNEKAWELEFGCPTKCLGISSSS